MNVEMRMFNGPTDWGWVQQHIPLKRYMDTCGLVAVDVDKNETVGAIILDNFLHNSCQASVIITNTMVLRHGFAEEGFDLVYEGFGKDYIYFLIADTNIKSLNMGLHAGAHVKTRFDSAYAEGIDLILLELHRDNCTVYQKYLKRLEEAA